MPIAAGVGWVAQFPTRRDTASCTPAFRQKLDAFLAALNKAGAQVRLNATLRPPERAYLMQTAWDIAHGTVDPTTAPSMPGVDIDWVVRNAAGQPDIGASRAVAQEMVKKYEIVARPSRTSLHITGEAVDMDISWNGALTIADRNGGSHTITSLPRDGTNLDLVGVGATYEVIKAAFGTDPPHWSKNGS